MLDLDGEAFPDLEEREDEEPPPASGEVASQRKPAEPADIDSWVEQPAVAAHEPPAAVELRLVVDPAPAPAAVPDAFGPVTPIAIEIEADVTRRAPLRAGAAVFVGAARASSPTTFGDLLDMALALGDE